MTGLWDPPKLATELLTEQVTRKNENMPQDEYARIERERRFLLAQFPSIAIAVRHTANPTTTVKTCALFPSYELLLLRGRC